MAIKMQIAMLSLNKRFFFFFAISMIWKESMGNKIVKVLNFLKCVVA